MSTDLTLTLLPHTKLGVKFQNSLIRWFQTHNERLPWRRTRDPYKIWVSEIMLQQTTVGAVIPYYQKFVRKFPNCRGLAQVPLKDVLSLWSGLGYYSRARNLHKGAKLVMEKYQGRLPKDPKALQKIPGIGRYTAGAIASIAFQKNVPLVDGNVMRVYARLFWITKDIKKHQGYFWKIAQDAMAQRRPGDFNQGLMELGRRICTPKNPDCRQCPLRKYCVAFSKGKPEALPRPLKQKETRPVTLGVALVQDRGRLLMVQRRDKTVLKDLWEFPTIPGGLTSQKIIQGLKTQWNLKTHVIQPLPRLKHSIMNQRITLYPFVCSLEVKARKRRQWQWIYPAMMDQMATSSMNKKTLTRFLERKDS